MSEQSNGIQQNKGVWSSPSPLHNLGHAEDQEMAEARAHREGRTREVRGGECGNLKRE